MVEEIFCSILISQLLTCNYFLFFVPSSSISLTNSDFPTDQTFHQFHDLYTELDLHRIMSGFHGAFATGVASQQGTLTLPDTWFRPPFWDLLMLQLLRPNSSNLPCLYSTFHLEYPSVLSRFCFNSRFLYSLTGYTHQHHRHLSWYPS